MKSLSAILVFVALSFPAFSQKQITVSEVSQAMSKGTHSGFKTEIPQAGIKDAERDWKRYLSSKGKGRQSEVNGEVIVKGLDDKDISKQPFNVYSVLISTDAGVSLTVWFTHNDSIFFSSNQSEATAAKRLVRDFAAAEYFLAVRNELKAEKDKLEKQKDELEKQIRQEERSRMKIEDNKRASARAQDDLAGNAIDQKEISEDIARQQTETAKARTGNGDAYKEADNALKSMEDEKKKLQSRNEELHKKLDELAKEITGEERVKDTARQAQVQLATDIEKQKMLIKEIEAKLKGIK